VSSVRYRYNVAPAHPEVLGDVPAGVPVGLHSGASLASEPARVRQVRLVGTVAAFLSDHQAPAQSVQCAGGIDVADGHAVGEQGVREPPWVAGGVDGVDQAVSGGPRLIMRTGDCSATTRPVLVNV